MKSVIRYCILLITFLVSAPCFAVHCTAAGGTKVYSFSNSLTSTNNNVGYTTGWQASSASGTYAFSDTCNGNRSTYYSATVGPGMTLATTDGTTNWYNIPGNDYLQVASQIYTVDNRYGSDYRNVPFSDLQNYCGTGLIFCGSTLASGSKVKINLKIKKKFVGASYIVNQTIAYFYGNQGGSGQGNGTPMAQINLNATMTVPQSCSINAGQVVEFDFGTLSAQSFAAAGAGNKPSTATTLTKTVDIECNNIAAQTTLTLRLEASNTSGNAVVSNNKDVGYILADFNNNQLTPNLSTSKIPFTLDDNDKSSVVLRSWPISITGSKPEVGTVTATGYLRADFD